MVVDDVLVYMKLHGGILSPKKCRVTFAYVMKYFRGWLQRREPPLQSDSSVYYFDWPAGWPKISSYPYHTRILSGAPCCSPGCFCLTSFEFSFPLYSFLELSFFLSAKCCFEKYIFRQGCFSCKVGEITSRIVWNLAPGGRIMTIRANHGLPRSW